MTRVFTRGEFRAGKIPSSEAFWSLLKLIKILAEETPAIIAGTLFGSFHRGDFDPTSDLDLLVVFDNDQYSDFRRVGVAWELLAQRTYTSLNVIPIGLNNHQLTLLPPFGLHLYRIIEASVENGVIKRNPIPYIVRPTQDPIDDTLSYLRHKHQKLINLAIKTAATQSAETTADEMEIMQEVLQLPTHIARKLIELVGVPSRDDSKAAVRQRYTAMFPETAGAFAELMTLKDHYCKMVAAKPRTATEQEYVRTLQILLEANDSLIEFVVSNIMLAEVIKRRDL